MSTMVAPVTPAQGVWTPDLAHTEVGFTARHLVVSKVRGRFERFSGQVEFGPELTDSKWRLTIETASVNSGQERRDGHLRSPDFFDAETFPTMEFVSTGVVVVDPTHLAVTGDLTIKDRTRSVTLNVEHGGVRRGLAGDAFGFSASTEINRDDWGLNWNVALEQGGWLVSPTIQIEVNSELTPAAA
jgi:polyisoprenoid-binding protein YceI